MRQTNRRIRLLRPAGAMANTVLDTSRNPGKKKDPEATVARFWLVHNSFHDLVWLFWLDLLAQYGVCTPALMVWWGRTASRARIVPGGCPKAAEQKRDNEPTGKVSCPPPLGRQWSVRHLTSSIFIMTRFDGQLVSSSSQVPVDLFTEPGRARPNGRAIQGVLTNNAASHTFCACTDQKGNTKQKTRPKTEWEAQALASWCQLQYTAAGISG